MGKFYCIYSGKEWPESERSKEHIIPFALGGSSEFVTYDVAEIPNREAGTVADASLINSWPIAFERWRLGLKSENGIIPPLEFWGTVDFEGRRIPMQYVVRPDGSASLKPIPEVETNWNTGKVKLFCDLNDASEIMESIDKKANRKGFTEKKVFDEWTKKIVKPTLHTELSFMLGQLGPGFLKLALATGHMVLGYRWSTGANADAIRKCMFAGAGSDWNQAGVKGTFWPKWHVPLRDLMRIDDDRHVILINNLEPIGVYCLLFGKYDGIVHLQEGLWNGSGIAPGEGIVFVVNCITRKTDRYSLPDFLAKKRNGGFGPYEQPSHE